MGDADLLGDDQRQGAANDDLSDEVLVATDLLGEPAHFKNSEGELKHDNRKVSRNLTANALLTPIDEAAKDGEELAMEN